MSLRLGRAKAGDPRSCQGPESQRQISPGAAATSTWDGTLLARKTQIVEGKY